VIRLWAGTSFKTPSYAVLYSDTTQSGFTVRGDEELDSEEIIAYDLGYEFPLFNKKAKGTINLFYNEMEKLIQTRIVGVGPPPVSSYYNAGERNVKGCETGIEFLVRDGITGFINHTYQDMRDELNGGRYKAAPKNKVNSGLRFIFDNGLTANLTIHYVDDYEMPLGKIDSYTLANGRIAYTFPDKDLEVALTVYNFLHDKHIESASVGDEIGTHVALNISYKF